MEKRSSLGDNSFGVTSVILGILSLVFSISMILSLILGVLALIFALVQRKKAPNKWSTWGIILAILGIALSILFIFSFVSVISTFKESINTCLANPNQPGCEQVLQALQQYGAR